MFWVLSRRIEARGERFRRVHERWLTRALAAGPYRYPRIPMRPVDAGGFSGLLSRPGGAALAARWWDRALERVDLDDTGG